MAPIAVIRRQEDLLTLSLLFLLSPNMVLYNVNTTLQSA
jgi:hypothetical protein